MGKASGMAKRVPRSREEFLGSEMTERQKVLAWLASIGETDQACIDEVIDQCKNDPEARAYYVFRYNEVIA